MKLKELIHKYNWSNVEDVFLSLYPDEKKNLEGLRIVFDKLKEITPEENSFEIVLQTIEEEDGESYVHVNAIDISLKSTDKFSGSRSLMGTPWHKWLFMPINKESKANFTETEIIAHCLWEMIFCGYDEESIQAFNDKLDEEMDEMKNLNSEEIKEKYTSFDEIKEKYNNPKA